MMDELKPVVRRVCRTCGSGDFDKHGNCKPCARAASKAYRLRNPEKVKAALTAWRERTKVEAPEVILKHRATYRDKNREALYAKNKAYQDSHKYEQRIYRRLYEGYRRTVAKGLPAERLYREVFDRLWQKQQGLCACCSKPLVSCHIDHIVPTSKGGAHVESNLQLLLPECNVRKGSKVADELQTEGAL